MAWYYALNNEQKGPVEQGEWDNLVRQGVVTANTLVWKEGMAGWQRYGEVMPADGTGGSAPPVFAAPPVAAGGVVCAECGQAFPPDEVIRIGNRFICAGCKPIAVQKLREGASTDSEAERIRKEHIQHEASVKSIALLYFIGGGFLVVMGLVMMGGIMMAPMRNGSAANLAMAVGFGVGSLVVAGLQIWTAIGLRQLRSWARIVSGVLSGIGLLGFPLGTLINAYILYLLFSKKGAMVFSDDYKRVIELTPNIKYRTSIVVWIFLGLLLVLLGLAVFGMMIGRLTGHR